jgi:signal transduction protein with GAF and PtsI domain
MDTYTEYREHHDLELLYEIGERIAAADPLHKVLARVVEFVSAIVLCDSCFLYVLDGDDLVLRASKNPHAEAVGRLKLRMGQGITGWVAEHKKPVAITSNAFQDPRFQSFTDLPEDRYEAFLSVPVLCRDKLVGVINVQHRQSHVHSLREIHLISTIGFLVGPEIEMARREAEYSRFSELAEARKLVASATEILQRDLQMSEDEASLALQSQSRKTQKSMKEVAEAILVREEIKRAGAARGLPS